MSKVSVIGAGNVGATCANVLAFREIADEVVLLDIKEGVSEGKAMDMMQAAVTAGFASRIKGVTNDYEATLKALKDRTWSERITTGILYFNQMLRYLIETPSAMILSGRFPKEYEQLIYKIKQLTDNKLYYRAAKLQQLLNLK